MRKLEEYIRIGSHKILCELKQFSVFGGCVVYIKDKLPKDFKIRTVFDEIKEVVPTHLLKNIEMIMIGEFDELRSRDLTAFYDNGTIYLTNHQNSEDEMIDDIIHELGHSLEEQFGRIVYGDRELEREFLSKRSKLESLVRSQGVNTGDFDFMEPDYSKELDHFFNNTVGYEKLVNLTMGLLITPYAATSLREYWATGFDHFLSDESEYLKKICPVLYSKIEGIINNG